MAGTGDARTELGVEAAAVLDVARDIAIQKFGLEAVQEIPRLVTDVALVMAMLQARQG